jgi:hypothetical protein
MDHPGRIAATEAHQAPCTCRQTSHTIDIPATGDGLTWKTIPLGTIELPAEEAVITLKPDPGHWKPIHLRQLALRPAP